MESVATARQSTVADEVDYLIAALGMLSTCLRNQLNLPEALAVAEESYIIASKHYSPAHKSVMRASVPLIDCLIDMKDYSTADAYCRMNYANLIDPVNAGEYSVDDGMNVMKQLVSIWLMKEPDEDEIEEKALADEAIDLSRKSYALSRFVSMRGRLDCLSLFYKVLLKANQLTEETEGLLHQYVRASTAEHNSDGNSMCKPFQDLLDFYSKLHESLPLGEEIILVQENIELCHKRLLELESCNDGSVGYIKGSQKIKPYFKNNVGFCI